MKTRFEVTASAAGDVLDILMYGEIGGGWYSEGITDAMVTRALKQAPNAKTIVVRLNSPGGDAFQGVAIKNILSQHKARVEAHVDGLAASAASIIAMGADEITMHEGAAMMVHEASTYTRGDANDHQRSMNVLETVNDGLAATYARRTKKSKQDMRALMAAETWLTPSAAVEQGFADVVGNEVPGAAAMFAASLSTAPYAYQNIPPRIAAIMDRVECPTATEPKPQETTRMSFKLIAAALALAETASEAEIVSAIGAHQGAMNDLFALTGTKTLSEALAAVRTLNESAKTVSALQDKLKQREDRIEQLEREALIAADAADPKGRKLTPAVAKLYAGKPVSELKAYLEAASPAIAPATQQQRVTQEESGNGEPLKHNGKTWSEMKPIEKHQLHDSDLDAYNALKRDHEQRTAR